MNPQGKRMVNPVWRTGWLMIISILFGGGLFAQVSVNGRIVDSETGDPLIGAKVVVKDQPYGALTDEDGEFSFKSPTAPPFNLQVTYLGYDTLDFEVTSVDKPLKIDLSEQSIKVQGAEIVGQSISEKQKQSPLTVESMGSIAIRQNPSSDFYTGLGNLKGVDVTAASLGFKIINTRGFNSTSPVRSLQIIDGVDNQAPGLNFSLGNFLGASELDVQKVDLVVGASSAFYGPNAFNGVISMETKDPFLHPGTSAMVKIGERNMVEGAIRFANSVQNKAGEDKFAYKFNIFFLRADDWNATNMSPTPQSKVGTDNPGGWDAVNRYGDENLTEGINNASSLTQQRNFPGLGIWHRTGYEEKDLVDYDTRNLKASAAFHYKINPRVEMILASNFGTGTTVYQGENRFSLRDILFFQNRIEIRQRDRFFLRAYATHEDAGNSYDAVFTAFQLQQAAKEDFEFTRDYRNYWQQFINPRVRALPGFPVVQPNYDYATADSVMAANYDSLVKWHAETRAYADSDKPTIFGNKPRYEPGTAEFDSLFNDITSRTAFSEGGTKFFDRSALYHVHGEYKFRPSWAEIVTGANGRLYKPNSDGTIFSDTNGRVITNWEFGIYSGIEKKVMSNRMKLNATVRLDKNQNFNFLVSPAASAVYSASENHTLRLSLSSAIRNPSLQDQYLYYNVGRAILLGNVDGFNNLVTLESLGDYFDTSNYDTIRYFDVAPVRPEKVRSIELGYRGLLGEKLYVDASYYFSYYKDFIGFQLGAVIDVDTFAGAYFASLERIYRVAANASDFVTTQGVSVGLNYYFSKYYSIGGNYSWNVLAKTSDDPIIPAFNTPAHKFNVSFSGRDIRMKVLGANLNDWGFGINAKWVQGFDFTGSPQFTGYVPSYTLVDAQINKSVKKIHSTFKIGASNLLNKQFFQVYGGPSMGRLGYFSVIVDLDGK